MFGPVNVYDWRCGLGSPLFISESQSFDEVRCCSWETAVTSDLHAAVNSSPQPQQRTDSFHVSACFNNSAFSSVILSGCFNAFLRHPAARWQCPRPDGKTDVRPVSLLLSLSPVVSAAVHILAPLHSSISPLCSTRLGCALRRAGKRTHTQYQHTATHSHTPLLELLQTQRRRKPCTFKLLVM